MTRRLMRNSTFTLKYGKGAVTFEIPEKQVLHEKIGFIAGEILEVSLFCFHDCSDLVRRA